MYNQPHSSGQAHPYGPTSTSQTDFVPPATAQHAYTQGHTAMVQHPYMQGTPVKKPRLSDASSSVIDHSATGCAPFVDYGTGQPQPPQKGPLSANWRPSAASEIPPSMIQVIPAPPTSVDTHPPYTHQQPHLHAKSPPYGHTASSPSSRVSSPASVLSTFSASTSASHFSSTQYFAQPVPPPPGQSALPSTRSHSTTRSLWSHVARPPALAPVPAAASMSIITPPPTPPFYRSQAGFSTSFSSVAPVAPFAQPHPPDRAHQLRKPFKEVRFAEPVTPTTFNIPRNATAILHTYIAPAPAATMQLHRPASTSSASSHPAPSPTSSFHTSASVTTFPAPFTTTTFPTTTSSPTPSTGSFPSNTLSPYFPILRPTTPTSPSYPFPADPAFDAAVRTALSRSATIRPHSEPPYYVRVRRERAALVRRQKRVIREGEQQAGEAKERDGEEDTTALFPFVTPTGEVVCDMVRGGRAGVQARQGRAASNAGGAATGESEATSASASDGQTVGAGSASGKQESEGGKGDKVVIDLTADDDDEEGQEEKLEYPPSDDDGPPAPSEPKLTPATPSVLSFAREAIQLAPHRRLRVADICAYVAALYPAAASTDEEVRRSLEADARFTRTDVIGEEFWSVAEQGKEGSAEEEEEKPKPKLSTARKRPRTQAASRSAHRPRPQDAAHPPRQVDPLPNTRLSIVPDGIAMPCETAGCANIVPPGTMWPRCPACSLARWKTRRKSSSTSPQRKVKLKLTLGRKRRRSGAIRGWDSDLSELTPSEDEVDDKEEAEDRTRALATELDKEAGDLREFVGNPLPPSVDRVSEVTEATGTLARMTGDPTETGRNETVAPAMNDHLVKADITTKPSAGSSSAASDVRAGGNPSAADDHLMLPGEDSNSDLNPPTKADPVARPPSRPGELDDGRPPSGPSYDNPVLSIKLRKCSVQSCTNLIPPTTKYPWHICKACRHEGTPTPGSVPRDPHKEVYIKPNKKVDAQHNRARRSVWTEYPQPQFHYPPYQHMDALIGSLRARLSAFLHNFFQLQAAAAKPHLLKRANFFGFDGENSVVVDTLDARSYAPLHQAWVMIQAATGFPLQLGTVRAFGKDAFVQKSACVHEMQLPTSRSASGESAVKPMVWKMSARLELAIMPDNGHPYFRGRKTAVRFWLVIDVDGPKLVQNPNHNNRVVETPRLNPSLNRG